MCCIQSHQCRQDFVFDQNIGFIEYYISTSVEMKVEINLQNDFFYESSSFHIIMDRSFSREPDAIIFSVG
jgi:hypothetical protein